MKLSAALVALLPLARGEVDGNGNTLPVDVVPPSAVASNPYYAYQDWYLGAHGANVVAAWAKGYTGAGVNVMVNDDGLDYTHPDFKDK
jgi:subtilisin family serine protease